MYLYMNTVRMADSIDLAIKIRKYQRNGDYYENV